MSRENVEVVRRVFTAVVAHDVEAVLRDFDPAVEIAPLRSHIEGTYRGHDGARRMAADLLAAMPDIELRVDDIRECGDRVVALGLQRGTVGDLPLEFPLAQVFEIAEGKVVRMQAFATAREALAAVGLSE